MRKKSTRQDATSAETKQDRCVWSESDEKALITHVIANKAKAGDGLNFDKTFWSSAAAVMASQPILQGESLHSLPLLI
jgi:hypothetical protein